MPFGQVIVGPPGCGKSTFCLAATNFMRRTGRQVCAVNLDPANDELPYKCDVDIVDLVSLDAVQEDMALGPNGGLAFCMDYLLQNFDWLEIVGQLMRKLHISLTAVQLVDAHLCVTPQKYLAAALACLTSMLRLELPHVNLVSKVDLLGKLSGDEVTDPEQLTDVDFLRHQLQSEPSHFAQRFAGLTSGLCDVIENYGLLTLTPVAVEQPQVLANAIDLIDRANGFNMSGLQGHNPYPEETKEQQSRLQQYLASGPSGIWSDAAGLADEKVGSQCTDALRRGDHAQD